MTMMHRWLAVTTCLLALGAGTALSAEPIRALLLTSPGVYHNYQQQTTALARGIAGYANVRFDVSLAEEERWKRTDYARGYDVLVYNICMADRRDADLIANMRRQTEELGTPTVVLHCTMHSFRETDLWWPLYGLKTRAHEPLGEMQLRHAADHPVLAGIPDSWTLPEDELYINLAFDADALLTSVGRDGAQHVTTWITRRGQTPVFGTTLGHSNATFEDRHFQRLVANGLLYVTGHLDGGGLPVKGFDPVSDPGDVIDSMSAPDGVRFLGEDGISCARQEMARAVGPCYIGCTLHPLKWGAAADDCRQACEGRLPSPDALIAQCKPGAG